MTDTMLMPEADDDADRVIERRIRGLADWLAANAPECQTEQAHLDADTRERVYWHYGYLTALRDVQALLKRQRRRIH